MQWSIYQLTKLVVAAAAAAAGVSAQSLSPTQTTTALEGTMTGNLCEKIFSVKGVSARPNPYLQCILTAPAICR